MRISFLPIVGVLLALASVAVAEPVTLRLATVAPDGTAWAREARTFATGVEAGTNGALRIKWYFGGIAGSELEMAARIQRGQLDGVASGGMLCQSLAHSVRILEMPGMLLNREEASFVLRALRSIFDEEFARAGFANLGLFEIGPLLLFSRDPIRTFSDMKKLRIWVWDLDEPQRKTLSAAGLRMVPLPIERAASEFDRDRFDAFDATPLAALAFQWSTQVHYVSELPLALNVGCLLVSFRAFDALPTEYQRTLRSVGLVAVDHMQRNGRRQDQELLGHLFQHQGLRVLPATAALRSEFLRVIAPARDTTALELIPLAVVRRVAILLADYRADHRAGGAGGEDRR